MFLLIDAHALIYRSFHALPKTLISPQGQLTNAAYGFTRVLLSTINEFQPQYLAVAFDHKDKTNRKAEYQEYKANRVEMPEELKPQIDLCKQVVRAMNIPLFEKSGFEADDLIGTISRILNKNKSTLTMIVSGDKDLFQLVDGNTHVFIPARGKFSQDKEYDREAVIKKMGITPEQVVDLKALMGDASDNIPGVAGIGPKTAVSLLKSYQNLAGVYQALAEERISGAVAKKLTKDKEQAFLSQKLATIDVQVEIDFDLEKSVVTDYDKTKVVELFDNLGFKSLVKNLPADKFESQLQEALF